MSNHPSGAQALFARIKAGDRQAFRSLFDQFYQLLLALAINILHDVDAAKDVVQEVFFQIWRKRDTLTVPTHPEAYLKRSTINRAYNQIKASKRIGGMAEMPEMTSSLPDGQDLAEAAEVRAAIQAALAQLPERCREVFVLKRIEGRSLKEIAGLLDISPKTAENQITKALKLLKEAVKPFLE